MRTTRNAVFETNSSSMHCFVVAPKDDFQKFIDGELFASEKSYKCWGDTPLITMDEVYEKYLNFCKEFRRDDTPVSKELLKKIMVEYDKFVSDDSDTELDWDKVISAEWPEAVRTELDASGETLLWTVECFLDMQYAPISYRMAEFLTAGFTMEYDDYVCVGPEECPDGTVKMHAVWYG